MLSLLTGVSVCLTDVVLQNRVGAAPEEEGRIRPRPVQSWGSALVCALVGPAPSWTRTLGQGEERAAKPMGCVCRALGPPSRQHWD